MNFPAVSSGQVQMYLGYFVCFKSRAAPIQGQMQNARFSIMKQNSAGSADFFPSSEFWNVFKQVQHKLQGED